MPKRYTVNNLTQTRLPVSTLIEPAEKVSEIEIGNTVYNVTWKPVNITEFGYFETWKPKASEIVPLPRSREDVNKIHAQLRMELEDARR